MRPVIADILQGKTGDTCYRADHLGYLEDLGLIVRDPQIRIANRIYREVIPRELTRGTSLALRGRTACYLGPDRRLDFPRLLAAFQQHFREESETWMGSGPAGKPAPSS